MLTIRKRYLHHLYKYITSKKLLSVRLITLLLLLPLTIVISPLFSNNNQSHGERVSSIRLQEVPLCTEEILKKESILPWQTINQRIPLIHKDGRCRLQFYDKSDMVTCIDALTRSSTTTPTIVPISNTSSSLHLTFVGDSRIHQIYMNFLLSTVPFIEDRTPDDIDDKPYRYDKYAETPLMDAYFSYRSLPTYDDRYIETVKNWVEGKSRVPNHLIIGSTAHHVYPVDRVLSDFEGSVTRLAVLLNELSERYGTRMVWWHDDVTPISFDIALPMMELNNIALRIFQENQVPIEIWDSSNDLFMAFIQTCDMDSSRKARWITPAFIGHPNSWINCLDPAHAPQAYATIQSQLFANHLCNRVMSI